MTLKIFFMGTTKLSYICVQKLISLGYELVGCASVPEIFQISYSPEGVKNINFFDFEGLAKELNIPCVAYNKENKLEFEILVRNLSPDLILVAGWYYHISNSIRRIPSKGVIALHASLLPKYRGGAPLVWAIINGEKETGVSLFYMDNGVDTGDIIGQSTFPIEDNDTIKDLLLKVEKSSENLLEHFLPLIEFGLAPSISQDNNKATVYPQRSPKDGLIDWSKSTEQIRNFIRAQTRPYPGAYTMINDKKVIIWDADIIDNQKV
ncbi:MAG: methionyl-tRNA formyltransferase [Pseudanabaena sp. M046S1SP1A06QC]|nr:methionyl-tRNA formyltransferase [Pseudanabaena sp. M046S1SP1A06QC]